MKQFSFLFLISISLIFFSCEEQVDEGFIPYEGPISELHDIDMNFVDSARTIVRMITPTQLTFADDNRKYPEEVKLWFYDKLGNVSSEIRGDSAKYTRKTNTYTLMGNVEIYNPQKDETIKTPEFIWYPDFSEIRSDSSVSVRTPTQTIYGKGFTAKQDFSEYTLKQIVRSVIEVPDLPTN